MQLSMVSFTGFVGVIHIRCRHMHIYTKPQIEHNYLPHANAFGNYCMLFKELKIFFDKVICWPQLLVAPACLHVASDWPQTFLHPRCFCLAIAYHYFL